MQSGVRAGVLIQAEKRSSKSNFPEHSLPAVSASCVCMKNSAYVNISGILRGHIRKFFGDARKIGGENIRSWKVNVIQSGPFAARRAATARRFDKIAFSTLATLIKNHSLASAKLLDFAATSSFWRAWVCRWCTHTLARRERNRNSKQTQIPIISAGGSQAISTRGSICSVRR